MSGHFFFVVIAQVKSSPRRQGGVDSIDVRSLRFQNPLSAVSFPPQGALGLVPKLTAALQPRQGDDGDCGGADRVGGGLRRAVVLAAGHLTGMGGAKNVKASTHHKKDCYLGTMVGGREAGRLAHTRRPRNFISFPV